MGLRYLLSRDKNGILQRELISIDGVKYVAPPIVIPPIAPVIPRTYSQPPANYYKPPTTYSQPSSTYSQPPAAYGQKPPTYGQVSNFRQPSKTGSTTKVDVQFGTVKLKTELL
jgi:hypothetical protein